MKRHAELEARLAALESRLGVVETGVANTAAVIQSMERSVSDLARMAEGRAKADIETHQLHLRLAQFALQGNAETTKSATLALAPLAEIIHASGLFDEGWYLARYPDIDPQAIEPVVHYINVGAAEGRDPGPHFSSTAYLEANPDVAAAGYNPLVHYLRWGVAEGRPAFGSMVRAAPPDAALTKYHTHPFGSKRAGEMNPSPERLALVLSYEFDRDTALIAGLLSSRARDGFDDIGVETQAVAGLASRIAVGEPRISIMIPVHNQISYTLACIHSIFLNPPKLPFEVIVGDDLSRDETKLLARSAIRHLRVIRHPQALGFLQNCNRIAEAARGEIFVLLNNDTLVLPGTFDEIAATLNEPRVGLVGSRLLNDDGTLQEAGAFVFADGVAWNFGRGDDPLDPRYNYRRDTDYCSAASIGVLASLWRTLGGFDERYRPAYYEDTDLAMRVRDAGYRVVYQPRSAIIHFEGQSHGRDESAGIKRQQVINKATFADRWRDQLSGMGSAGADELPVARNARGRVLVVDAEIPRPDTDSGSIDAFEVLRALVDAGYAVTFIPENLAPAQPYTADLNRIGVETVFHPYCSGLADLLQKRGTTFDLVMLSRAGVAEAAMPLVKAFAPQARVIFNTVDLHFLRLSREAALAGDPKVSAEAEAMRKIELGLIKRTDATIVVSEYERSLLAAEVPDAKVVNIPILRSPPATSLPAFAQRSGILFVGGFRHRPNVDAVMWFAREVWPLLKQSGFDAPFSVVGSHMPDDFRFLANLGITVRGFVDDLGALLDSTRLTIAPLRYGAGLKGKVITSLSYGVPVVGTSIAVEGSDLRHLHDVVVADEAAPMAEAILSVHNDESVWNDLSRHGRETFLARFSTAAVSTKLISLVDELLPPRRREGPAAGSPSD